MVTRKNLSFCRLAPEIFVNYVYSTESDVWSYGILCLEVLTQNVPYPDVPTPTFVFAFAKGLRPHKCIWFTITCVTRQDIPEECSDSLKTLFYNIFAEDPKQRPTFRDIYNGLETINK